MLFRIFSVLYDKCQALSWLHYEKRVLKLSNTTVLYSADMLQTRLAQ